MPTRINEFNGRVAALSIYLYLKARGEPLTEDNFSQTIQDDSSTPPVDLLGAMINATQIEIHSSPEDAPGECTARLSTAGDDSLDLTFGNVESVVKARFLEILESCQENNPADFQAEFLAEELYRYMKKKGIEHNIKNFCELASKVITIDKLTQYRGAWRVSFEESLPSLRNTTPGNTTPINEEYRREVFYLTAIKYLEKLQRKKQ